MDGARVLWVRAMDVRKLLEEHDDEEDIFRLLMDNFNHPGQRADKYVVHGGTEDGYKDVEHYTMTCPECESVGRYDDRGDVVCENDECGVLIAGPESPMSLPVDHGNSRGFSRAEDTPGKLENRGSLEGRRGSTEPMI